MVTLPKPRVLQPWSLVEKSPKSDCMSYFVARYGSPRFMDWAKRGEEDPVLGPGTTIPGLEPDERGYDSWLTQSPADVVPSRGERAALPDA